MTKDQDLLQMAVEALEAITQSLAAQDEEGLIEHAAPMVRAREAIAAIRAAQQPKPIGDTTARSGDIGASDALPDLNEVYELARPFAVTDASPHHMTFTVIGLRAALAAMKGAQS